jgi:hypothetical protein
MNVVQPNIISTAGGTLPAKAAGFAFTAARSKPAGIIAAIAGGNLARRALGSCPARALASKPFRAPMAPLANSAGVLNIAVGSQASRAVFPVLKLAALAAAGQAYFIIDFLVNWSLVIY